MISEKKYLILKKIILKCFFYLTLFFLVFVFFIFIIYSVFYFQDRVIKGEGIPVFRKEYLLEKKILNKEDMILFYYESFSIEGEFTHIQFFTNNAIYDFTTYTIPEARKTNLNQIQKLEFNESESSIKIITHKTEYKLYLSNHFGKDKDFYQSLNELVSKSKQIK